MAPLNCTFDEAVDEPASSPGTPKNRCERLENRIRKIQCSIGAESSYSPIIPGELEDLLRQKEASSEPPSLPDVPWCEEDVPEPSVIQTVLSFNPSPHIVPSTELDRSAGPSSPPPGASPTPPIYGAYMEAVHGISVLTR